MTLAPAHAAHESPQIGVGSSAEAHSRRFPDQTTRRQAEPIDIKRSHRTTDANPEMSRQSFTTRSTGVLFWGAGYLLAAIGWGLAFAALWPQGSTCSATCGQRIEAGGVVMLLLASGGLAGLAVAVWLGVTRRSTAPRSLAVALLVLLVIAIAAAVALESSRSALDDREGLATVRSAWSWGLAVPTSALLAVSGIAGLRERIRTRRARPARSARVRRA